MMTAQILTAVVGLEVIIATLADGVSGALVGLRWLNRATLAKRAATVLAYFDRSDASNGPAEAINGSLQHLSGSALGFRNLVH